MISLSVCVYVVFSLQLKSASLLSISPDDISKEWEDAHAVINAIKKLKEIFSLRDLPPSSASHRKAPQFMLDLFDAVTDSNGIVRNSEVLEGNVVRSFAGQSNGTFHFFNVSSFGKNEKIIKAEFRWFRKKQPFLLHRFYKVDLYEVLDSSAKPWRGNLITSRLLPAYTQGWEVFTITQTVSKWIHNSDANNGILVVTTLPSGNWLDIIVPPERVREPDEGNAYLVIFSDDGRRGSVTNLSLHNGQNLDASRSAVTAEEAAFQNPGRRRRIARAASSSSVPCQRTPLYVDFEKIGWSGWIISPRGYNAYHCKGSCPFPLGESLRATNHATVQSIVHALKLSNDVATPCCVPDELQPISLLYFDDEENVVLKQYDNMVAVSCGCH